MRRLKAKLKKSWGVRQTLGLSIILASMTLSFMLVSCGSDGTPTAVAQTNNNRVNAPAQQATTPGTNTPAGGPPAPVITTPAAATVSVVVAARQISPGTIIGQDDVTVILKSTDQYDPNEDLTDVTQAISQINKVAYVTGQPIRKDDLIQGSFSSYMRELVAEKRLEPGKKAFAYATNDLATVSGLIQENDLVDVVATYVVERRVSVPVGNQVEGGGSTAANNPGVELTTKTVLQNVRVLKVIHLQVPAPIAAPAVATSTAGADTPTAVVAAPPTATPTPTLPPLAESGSGFDVNTILILGVTDQEAEVLKFTREYRLTGTIARINPSNPVIAIGDTTLANFGDAAPGGVSVVHFVLRPKPQDPANPVDPALQVERTTGVTFRILIRDYGLQIPELIFATSTQ